MPGVRPLLLLLASPLPPLNDSDVARSSLPGPLPFTASLTHRRPLSCHPSRCPSAPPSTLPLHRPVHPACTPSVVQSPAPVGCIP